MGHLYQDQDDLLLQELREGSVRSFNLLYEKYWYKIYTSAFRRLKNKDQAQDITQDIFAQLWLKRQELKIDNLPAYLHIAVRNRVLNLFEKERRYVPIEQLLPDHTLSGQNDPADAGALRNEFLAAYKALIDALPDQRKKIFRYYYDDGLSTEEIAARLGLSRKTVQNQLGRAVTSMRTSLSHLFILGIIICLAWQ